MDQRLPANEIARDRAKEIRWLWERIFGIEEQEETWQAIVPLESYVNQTSTSTPLQIPVYSTVSGVQMRTILLRLHVSMNTTPPASTPISSSAGGLVSLVGLDTLMEDNGGLPMLDYDV
jgi:hypothetical protein